MRKGKVRETLDGYCSKFLELFPEQLQKELYGKFFISGGAITSLLQDKPVNDIDIYITDFELLEKILTMYCEKLSINPPRVYEYTNIEGDVERRLEVKDRPATNYPAHKGRRPVDYVYIGFNAIGLAQKFQLIYRFYGKPEQVHKNFDFLHCTAYYRHLGELSVPENVLYAITSKTLVYVGSLYPICSLVRTRKFLKRGYGISAGEYVKMAYQCGKINFNNKIMLKDQLMGVDSLFFEGIIAKLETMETFSASDLARIIDEAFESV